MTSASFVDSKLSSATKDIPISVKIKITRVLKTQTQISSICTKMMTRTKKIPVRVIGFSSSSSESSSTALLTVRCNNKWHIITTAFKIG